MQPAGDYILPILPCQLQRGIVLSKEEDLCADSSCLI